MLRTAAMICILSHAMCYEVRIKLNITITEHVFGPITVDATNSNQCTNLICSERCSNNTPDPSQIVTLTMGQDGKCSCSCGSCGYRNRLEPTLHRSITNEFPWIVAIFKEVEENGIRSYDYKCVGSLIHPSVVLTAAHCVSKIESSKLMVRVGDHNTIMSKENFNGQNIQVAEYIIHEENSDYGNDIALVFLEKPVNITTNINTICLPPQNANFDLQLCLASGWGKNAVNGTFQTTLQTVELPIVPRDKCVSDLRATALGSNFNLDESIICAGGEANKDACEGDGGAPLVCEIPGTRNHYQQVGIVSWGIGCGDLIPAAYVNVALFRNWIDEKLRSKFSV